MKRTFLYPIFLIVILGSCCKVYLATGLTFHYPNLNSPAELKVYSINKENSELIMDTLLVTELNASNDYTYFVEFRSPEVYDYLIEVDSIYSDTITDYTYEVKGFNCNTRVESNEYLHNGSSQTNMTLEIQ